MPEQLQLLIRSGHSLISMETCDEIRADELLTHVASAMQLPLATWSLTTGLTSTHDDLPQICVAPGKPVEALKFVTDVPRRALFVFKDISQHARDPHIQRLLRDVEFCCARNRSCAVLVDSLPLPESVRQFCVDYELKPPTREELEEVVRSTFRRISRDSIYEIKSEITKRQMEQLVLNLRGLSCQAAARVVASVIHLDNRLDGSDIPLIVDAKRKLLSSIGCLESISVDRAGEDVGGMRTLKQWLHLRRGGFSEKAAEFGVEPPRGILLLGVQGCGKSLCAKAVAADWNMPLLKLDPGILYQKFIGESESRLRQALRQAEAMAPVVLWIDEIEKAFASAGASSADGGLSQRMFGTLLSWMQEHRHPIFIVATANNIEALPPELMRKGRFDEIFFVDLPDLTERAQILKIHLERKQRNPDEFDLPALAKAAEGFSGAELEQAVLSSLYRAFSETQPLATEHIALELSQTRPLSKVLGEKVQALRRWAQNRCIPAN